tara:strand:+ start:7220 stop:7429 length:210 start_codon:yes stop_codon:yes gene_type:complete
VLPIVLKLLTPSVVKGIMDYVFKKNDLDYKMEKLIERVEELEKHSHPPKKWGVMIEQLRQEIKQMKEEK